MRLASTIGEIGRIIGRMEAERQRFYMVGGIAALVLGVGYVVIFGLYARTGAPPSGGEAWFSYLPGKTTLWWTILWISVFTDVLYVPIALALYQALGATHRIAMQLASAFVGLFVALDLTVTWSHYASILVLFGKYAAATNEVDRASYIAAANYGSAVLTSPLEIVYSIVTLSAGILIIGIVMVRERFDKVTGYLAVATGVLGIASLTRSGYAIVGNALFATVWLFFVGYRLCRVGRS